MHTASVYLDIIDLKLCWIHRNSWILELIAIILSNNGHIYLVDNNVGFTL